MIRVLLAAVAGTLAIGTGWAQQPSSGPMSMAQLQDYVAILMADRQSYAAQIDQLRLQLEEQRRQAAERDAAVDRYWRQWTGLDKQK